MLSFVKKIIPRSLLSALLPAYHFSVAWLAALAYGFPSRNIHVVAVTGTKGKTTTTELVNAILEEAGYSTALASTLRFKIGHRSERNMLKMTMPGRFFLQRFLRKAIKSGCTYAVIEMSSEGAKQFRHRFIELDALIVTNLSPEHIESHGSYEKYKEAKLSIARKLERSSKKRTVLVVNKDDRESACFLPISASETYTYSLEDATAHSTGKDGIDITIDGKKMHSHLPGMFNTYNILGAVTYARTQDISLEVIANALEGFRGVRGRMERVCLSSPSLQTRQNFDVIVDYAHTADSLEKAYKVFEDKNKICVLGGTGGGRDKWKRVKMGEIASAHCKEIILTNEDPYDEDPQAILLDIGKGIKNKHVYTVLNRREAIRKGIEDAKKGDVVFITGKGTDPYIMEKDGTKIPWDDATVAREEIEKILTTR
ncbi:MAG: UDP-N-acetylmuramyl-tripeptide synthetase [Patescibacteria group bacterium]|nr:UDP-N-acetylmuramyl-tripeptide synthetase [bacterium]MDZ4240984.1 UDP-N-acetylmuramyl-tripeptide synthetase [Patescibacteria group bacterium]